jgi:hypothetical protein
MYSDKGYDFTCIRYSSVNFITMKDFFKNKKNLYTVAGAVVALVTLAVFIWIKIADFKGARDKQQTIVSDPKITESTKNREYSEVSRESAAGIFAGRDSLRMGAPERSTAATTTIPGAVESGAVVRGQPALPAVSETVVPENPVKNNTNRRRPVTNNNTRDTVVKTALEQQLEQIEAQTPTPVPNVPKKREHKEEAKGPYVNLTVVKSRKPSVYSTYKEELTTTHDNVVLFSAKVYGFQKIKTNETVTLRNTETITANGHLIAAGSIFRGVAKMSGNRMTVDVTSAVSREGRYSVKMSVYDNDFVKGIFVKEVSEATEENMSSAADAAINIATSAVPFGNVVKSVGKETAKQTQKALERQNKITITLEDGYEVYLAIANK